MELELGILDHYPLGVGAVVLVSVLLVFLEIGYRLGLKQFHILWVWIVNVPQ
jgi:hypothetical protein